MTAYAFATTELWPLTRGGAGRLNAELVGMLRTAGHDVRVVLVADVSTDDEAVLVVHPTDSAGWDIGFMALSKAAAEGLAEIHGESPIDRIEIQDFDGLAFWTLTHRGDLGFAEVPITVRFHGPVGLQVEAVGVGSHDLEVAAQMEHESFAMADATIVPSAEIRSLVVDRYHLEVERVLVGTPAVRELPPAVRDTASGIRFTVIGRLSEVKGSHDMVAASIPVLREFPEASVTFVGSDGWSATEDLPMREWLMSTVPEDLGARIVFLDQTDGAGLASIIARSTAVVAPSRFESFNLAVHEARRVGTPVVLPDIPAFSGVFDGGFGAEMYGGSVAGLTAALTRLARDPSIARRLSRQPVPMLGDPMDPYESPLPSVWHRRSQGGLATAALARLETVRFPPIELSRSRKRLQAVIRAVPAPVMDIARRALPERLKLRIREASEWDREEERQKNRARWSEVRARISNGDLGYMAAPKVSVVIPCFNQGDFVADAVLSVLEQTSDNIDIVIVDDGSDDGRTPGILDSLALPRLTVIHQENVGLPGARNRGIAAARGEYVVTLDADDELAPAYVEKLEAALDEDDTAAFAHCWAELFGDFEAVWATRPLNRYQLLLSNSIVGCVMMRKSAWEVVGGYDETMLAGNEDWDLWIRMSDAGYGAVQIREPHFRYRKHGVSMSVETEAGYESAMATFPERLSHIYSHGQVGELKRSEYPLLTVLTDDPSFVNPFDDVQIVALAGTDIKEAIRAIRGKYAVLWLEGTSVDPSRLAGLCETLERDEDLGAVETGSPMPLRVVRTWSIRDPDGPSLVAVEDIAGLCSRSLVCGQFPDPAWQVPSTIEGRPVQRQRPEEAGFVPAWVQV